MNRSPAPDPRASAAAPSRRTVVAAAAWTAPAIALSVASPAAAVSRRGVITLFNAPYSIRPDQPLTVTGTVSPAGSYSLSLSEIDADAPSPLTFPDTVSTDSSGMFSFTVSTTSRDQRDFTIEIGGTEVLPASFQIRGEEIAVDLAIATEAPKNSREWPYIREAESFSVIATRLAEPFVGQSVTLTLSDTTVQFSGGGTTFTGLTDDSGRIEVTIEPTERVARGSSTFKVTATTGAASATQDVVVASTLQTLTTTTAEALSRVPAWAVATYDVLSSALSRPTNSTDRWWRSGTEGEIELGSLDIGAATVFWATNTGSGTVQLGAAIPAGQTWTFGFVNISGAAYAGNWQRWEFDDASEEWNTVGVETLSLD